MADLHVSVEQVEVVGPGQVHLGLLLHLETVSGEHLDRQEGGTVRAQQGTLRNSDG